MPKREPSTTTVIRAASMSDAASIRAVYAPYVCDTSITFEEEVPSVAEFAARISAKPRLPWLIAEYDGRTAGYAYASKHRARASYRWSADVSVYLDADCHGRGVGRALYDRLLAEVRELGYITVFAGITMPNPASVGLHRSAGFEPVGTYRNVGYKQNSWHDVSWWTLPLVAEPPANPAEPREWSST